MAQLTDDCFAFAGSLMRVGEIERLIAERVAPVAGMTEVPLHAALGRVLAGDIVAAIDLPPFANSAVDGYAVRHADLAAHGETRLVLAGRVQAGDAVDAAPAGGGAVRIFTGAPMPAGTDTVFMQEDVRVEDGAVVLPSGLAPGANRRPAGEDVVAGKQALAAGRRLGPADIALAAALGLTALPVRVRLRVALFSTGNEVVEPGRPRPPSRIYDANRPMVAALLQRLGAETTDLGILADDPGTLRAALTEAAAGHDLVISTGGVSTGEADHMRAAVEAVGRLVFWRIAVKPGRPVAMGVVRAPTSDRNADGGAAFVGLPGNPVAVFVTFARVARPLLLRLAGALPEPLLAYPVRAAFAHEKKPGRREYLRVSLRAEPDGMPSARKHPREGAGIISSLTETDGLAEIAEDVTGVSPGDSIGFIPYSALLG